MIYSEEQYPFLVNDIIKYIQKIKETEKATTLVDIIMDYCFKFNVEIELVGDAISSDLYFKSFIEKDCEINKMFKTKNNINTEEW